MMISVAVSGFILALAAGVFIAFVVLVSGFIPLALAAGVFIAFFVLVSGVIRMALAARVFIASKSACVKTTEQQTGCPSKTEPGLHLAGPGLHLAGSNYSWLGLAGLF